VNSGYRPNFVITFLRIALGATFVFSSVGKLNRPGDFLAAVYDYQMVGPRLGVAVATVLPWLELIVGICLLAGILIDGALILALAMGCLFVAV
jgi:uncharacterized membrane protein YphA (DoxX/SURF4 family)